MHMNSSMASNLSEVREIRLEQNKYNSNFGFLRKALLEKGLSALRCSDVDMEVLAIGTDWLEYSEAVEKKE